MNKSIRKCISLWMTLTVVSMTSVICFEVGCQFLYHKRFGKWRYQYTPHHHQQTFDVHPYLVGAPKPSINYTFRGVTISHSDAGYRSADSSQSVSEDVTRVVTLGGSTTYCVGVSDPLTWPRLLEVELGIDYQGINMGVPGYSTVENIIQTSLHLSEIDPDYCIYYLG